MFSSPALLALIATLYINFSLASNGDPDNGVHKYAGFVVVPSNGTGTLLPGCPYPSVFYACSGSLVSIPGFPERRMFLTARHCASEFSRDDTTQPFRVSFGENPRSGRVTSLATCGPFAVDWQSTPGNTFYSGLYSWFIPYAGNGKETSSKGPALGQLSEDYALILLNESVSTADVDQPAIIFDSSTMSYVDLVLRLPVIGMAGYGIVGYGDASRDPSLGKPVPINGNRTKKYIEQRVRSITPQTIMASGVIGVSEQMICSGDSGAGGIKPEKVDGLYNVYGVVSSGDPYCRATATFTRVGTSPFYAFLESIKADVLNKAA